MSDNPFESLGGPGGGFDFQGLLQQAQQMQEQLENAQQELADARVDGTVAGGAVVGTRNGNGELIQGKIKARGGDGPAGRRPGGRRGPNVAARPAAQAPSGARPSTPARPRP